MKKLSALLLCAALALSFAGCSEKAQTNDAAAAAAENTAANSTQQAAPDNAVDAAQPQANGSENENTQAADAGGTDTGEGTTPAADRTGRTTTAKSDSSRTTEKQTTAENKTLTCTVMIECTDILRHMDELDKSAARHLPDDGVILQSVQISVKNGDSVYDAVEAACKKGGVAINAQKSIYGTYIAGFGGINEKCCGSDSGWLYFVNGESPSLASSACKVKNGDKIEFRFACDPPDAANYSN